MKKTLHLKQAKATKKDIEDLCNFFNVIEEYLTCGDFSYENEQGELVSESITQDRFVEIIKQLWCGDWIGRTTGISKIWHRIVLGYETLYDNACDPDSDFLEWKPAISDALALQESLKKKEETTE